MVSLNITEILLTWTLNLNLNIQDVMVEIKSMAKVNSEIQCIQEREMCSFTRMGLITRMYHWNGHLYVSWGTFYLVSKDRVA